MFSEAILLVPSQSTTDWWLWHIQLYVSMDSKGCSHVEPNVNDVNVPTGYHGALHEMIICTSCASMAILKIRYDLHT